MSAEDFGNIDPNIAVGSSDYTDYNPTTSTQQMDVADAISQQGLLSGSTDPSNFLSRLFGGSMTSGDKAGAMLGLGALAIAQSLANKPPAIKQPVYKQAPVYNRALTAPMYGLGYLNPQTGKQVGQGMPLFFNPNPFQFNPAEAAKRYGPTPEQIAAGQQVYQQQMADLYTPRSVPDVQMTGTSTVTGATGNDTVSGRGVAAPKTLPSDPIQAFRSSSEYQDFLKANEGGIGTMDMYDSPYFGPVSSGSYGGAQDKAYKDWYQKTYNTEAPIVYKTQSNQASDMAGLLNTVYGQNASAPVQAAITVPAETGMAGGGFLKGRGDGMSDEIKATINEKQPARLSDGEFVIPADVVAHLGNGSSKAGAQKLYDMMARVRKARTGKTEQAPEINPNKFV